MSYKEYIMEIIELLTLSVQQHASDLHIVPGLPPMVRINGDFERMENQPVLDAEATRKLLGSILDAKQRKKFAEKREIDFALSLLTISRFRGHAFHQTNGMAGVFRSIPERISTLDEWGMPTVFKQLLDLPHGLIVVTGPTSSGKSTTLAAMVDYINKHQACHIITIEDPIEFIHTSCKSIINQREVGRHTIDFKSALHSALREDPDVILLGEMRDLETMRLALTAAETGHLVMATLHTSSAPRAITRIVDAFPSNEKNMIRHMLSESLQAIICQTLVKSVAGGRIAAFEIMLGTQAIRHLIREDKIAQMYSTMQTGSESGMCTLDQYLQKLVDKRIITSLNARNNAFIASTFAE